jgi:2-polyprenyl-3-methyl-5-hydroxy-6-metoxy-1,4-benzoquinol methylase
MNLKKFNEKKIFVTGLSGSGKTTFTKFFSVFYNILYFDFEANWGGYVETIENQYEKLIQKLPDEFIIDAIPYKYKIDNTLNSVCMSNALELNLEGWSHVYGRLNFLDYYEKNKDDIKIICVCCTNRQEFEKRLKFTYKIQAYNEYYNFYHLIIKKIFSKLNIEYFDSYANEFISEEELYKRISWINEDNINAIRKENLLQYINKQEYDKLYQDIECINFIGYTESFKTWDNIKNLVDWKGKKVADLGCFHGYFSLKTAKEGANVTGFDINPKILETTNYINEIEGDIINLKRWTGGEEISAEYDITLCLNVLHYFSNTKEALHNIKSKTVIFETNQDLVNVISKEFNITKKVQSHRPDINNNIRIILLCEKK